ncbi:PqqD family protein [Flavobacterium sp.]|uniref:PqqD family protein n=1 Tax=Flavobacterium sp. TaxID=239 RepID=UPI00286D987B|nr:PqqD family protein [Flavobacterium sp.]
MKVNRNLAISENGFVFNPTTGDSFSVNELGALIINEIKTGKTKKEIIETISQEFEVEKSTIEKDFNEYLNVLSNHQLVENND